jgi:hypothetical protein
MNEQTSRRVGAWAGAAFVVLSVLATFLYPQPPRIDSDPAVILDWVHPHRVGLEAGMVLGVFTGALFVFFVAQLGRRLGAAGSRALGSVLYGSGIAFAAVYALGAVPVATLVFIEGQPGGFGDGALVRLLIDLNQMMLAPAMAFGVVFLVTAGIAIVGTEVFAPWLGWAAIVISVPNAILVATSLTFSSYHAGGWTVMNWAAYIGFLVVILLISVAMNRGPKSIPGTLESSAAV